MTGRILEGRPAALAIPLVLAAVLLGGCFNPFNPRVERGRVGVSDPPPQPTRPDLVVRLLEWCYDHRAYAEYEEIFTEDFVFAFAETDSAGRPFLGQVLRREDELVAAHNLFVGGGSSPPANSISLTLDSRLYAEQDTRPGKGNTTYHRELATTVSLRIDTDEEDYEVNGTARFFLVRGDSAVIPQDLKLRGFVSDSARWWIERWEDETIGTTAAYAAGRGRSDPPPGGRLPAPDAARAPLRDRAQSLPVDATWGFVKAVFHRSR